ncbi:hypothetical protein [Hominisplanchenecus sp.]|uniref:hypothetical protein n=1 Tax=Hominisplanchenecus sp. TaxID=3038130 RepID=UPI0039953B95
MKISIKTSDKKSKYMTHIIVNGIDLGMYASRYQLKQEPGEIPVLSVDIPVTDMDIDLPEGCVIVRQEAGKHETECGTSAGSD